MRLKVAQTVFSTFQDIDFDGSLLPLTLLVDAMVMVSRNKPVPENIGAELNPSSP